MRGISRTEVVECKMWVDELIIRDMVERGGKPAIVSTIREGPFGAEIFADTRTTKD